MEILDTVNMYLKNTCLDIPVKFFMLKLGPQFGL